MTVAGALLAIAQLASVVQLPYQWLEACARAADGSCRVASLTPLDLAYINKLISEEIAPDPNPVPRRAWVAFPESRAGVCDTHVMTKRAALLALGQPADSMRIELGEAVYPDGRAVAHMVLWVTLDGKTWALDNLTPDRIYQRGSRPYEWRATGMQPDAGALWVTPPAPGETP